MNAKLRNIKIEKLRALAIISVVVGHSIILYSNSWNTYQTSRQVPFLSNVKDIINCYQMPLFFAISGWLFAYHPPSHGFLPFLWKKVKRLLFPFLVIGTCVMIPVKMLVQYPPYYGKSYFSAVLALLKGTETGHLWFLPTLFCVFLIAYALFGLFGNHFSTWGIATVAGILAYSFHDSVPLFLPLFQYFRWTMKFFWSFSFGAALFHLSEHNCYSCNQKMLLSVNGGIVAFLVFLSRISVFNIPTIAISIPLVLLLFLSVSEKPNHTLHSISENSFGIYLFHSPLIYVTFSCIPDANPLLVVSINLFVFGVVAYLLSILISKSTLKAIIGK